MSARFDSLSEVVRHVKLKRAFKIGEQSSAGKWYFEGGHAGVWRTEAGWRLLAMSDEGGAALRRNGQLAGQLFATRREAVQAWELVLRTDPDAPRVVTRSSTQRSTG